MSTNIHLTPGDLKDPFSPLGRGMWNWFPNAAFGSVSFSTTGATLPLSAGDIVIFDVDAKHVGNFALDILSGGEIETVDGCEFLTQIRDAGTTMALPLQGHKLTTSEINKIFTELPATTRTATINVSGNPGAATCDPSIATAKGYTVVN